MAPDRQHTVYALLVVGQHGGNHIFVTLGFEQGQEGMFGPVGVPEGENGVVGEAIGQVQLMV